MLLISYTAGWSELALKRFCDYHQSRGVQELLRNVQLKKLRVFMVEAKSKKYSRSLKTRIPQMAGECIAT
jgi:hypothetical protein